MATLQERAKQAAKEGYAVSESVYAPGLYNVHKPNSNTFYFVDLDGAEPRCNCQATVICKHIGLVQMSLRFVATLARKAAAAAAPVRTRRRFFSAKHIAAIRGLAPTMAPVKPIAATEIITITTKGRKILSAAEMARRMDADFGPGANY